YLRLKVAPCSSNCTEFDFRPAGTHNCPWIFAVSRTSCDTGTSVSVQVTVAPATAAGATATIPVSTTQPASNEVTRFPNALTERPFLEINGLVADRARYCAGA